MYYEAAKTRDDDDIECAQARPHPMADPGGDVPYPHPEPKHHTYAHTAGALPRVARIWPQQKLIMMIKNRVKGPNSKMAIVQPMSYTFSTTLITNPMSKF